jgi:septal ring factor EnvC (AmiA/AmiB activator)
VTYRTDSSYSVDESYEADEDEPRRGLLSWLLIVTMLIGTGSASALIWRTFGGSPILPSMTSSAAPAAVAVAVAQTPSGQADLAALRQEITGSVQSTQALLAAQQAEIKRLSEQVSALSSKLELMQRPVASAQAAIPVPQPVAPAPKKKPEAKPAAAKPAQARPVEASSTEPKPVENKPANGPISTGGTPLQLGR